jgi:nucleoside-diphosphate-sugar epimerase
MGATNTSRSRTHVFVTGATGVVGQRVVPELARLGYHVTAVGRTPEKRAQLARWGAEGVALDLFDRAAVERGLADQNIVINLATHMPSSSFKMMLPWAWRENDRVRRDGSAILVNAASAAGVSRFIQESFAPIYEDAGDAWIDERSPVRPAAYNRTVLDAERSAERFTERGGIGVVLRFASFYGPDSMVLREMAGMVRRGWSPLPGRGDAYWSSVSHDDAASAVIAALGIPSGTYNVSDDEPLTRREWVDALADAVGVRHPRSMPTWLARVGGSTMRLLSRSQRLSNAKLRGASGWGPTCRSAREGLAASVRNW